VRLADLHPMTGQCQYCDITMPSVWKIADRLPQASQRDSSVSSCTAARATRKLKGPVQCCSVWQKGHSDEAGPAGRSRSDRTIAIPTRPPHAAQPVTRLTTSSTNTGPFEYVIAWPERASCRQRGGTYGEGAQDGRVPENDGLHDAVVHG
jgi:hypothetical protein